eukprot:6492143-Amphidinium_carterae.1
MVMRDHGKHWLDMEQTRKDKYEKLATVLQAMRRTEATAEIDELTERLLQPVQEDETLEMPGSMHLRGCRLEEQAWNEVQMLYDSELFTPSSVHKRRLQSITTPLPLSEQEVQKFSSLPHKPYSR